MGKALCYPISRTSVLRELPSPLPIPHSFKHEHCSWPPGEPAWLSAWPRHSLPCLCGCRWLTHTPASSAGCHLFWAGGLLQQVKQTVFYQETQVSRKTIKEIWIDQIIHPSRKQNWIQTFSKLSSNKHSGHWADKHRHLMLPCEPMCLFAATQKVQHEGAGLPASLTLLELNSWHTLWKGKPLVRHLPCTLGTTTLLGVSLACELSPTKEI